MGDQIIHISWGGPERWLQCAGKNILFEDHPYCGPIILTPKTRDPATVQPPEHSPVWTHINAWYQQGKRVKRIGDQEWCVYQTHMQEARRLNAKARTQEEEKP